MANIGVRSPYFVNYEDATATALSSKILVYQMVGDPAAEVLKYTIIKNTGADVRLDLSEISRDFVDPTYSGTLTTSSPGAATMRIKIQFYDALNATGTEVGSLIVPDDFVCYDAYNYFHEGNNFNITSQNLISGDTIWAPIGASGSFYTMTAGGLVIATYGSETASVSSVTIKRQHCSKYIPVKVVFINKFGVPQELYFFAKKVESVRSAAEGYKSSRINADGSYSVYRHQKVTFDKNASKSYVLNTDYVDESYNNYIQELMLSEQVWLNIPDNTPQVIPVRVASSEVSYKTSLNDRLVNYTVEFEEANDLISSIR